MVARRVFVCSIGPRFPGAPLLLVLLLGSAPASAQDFVRGDADASGSREVTDGIRILLHLFSGGDPPPCLDAADLDDDGAISFTDAMRLLVFLFSGGEAPAAPFPGCGPDPTEDALGCDRSTPCDRDEFGELAASFGILDTLAGAGELQGEGVNEWRTGFEGGAAKGAELSTPHNALGDDAGNIYIADKDAHAIRKVTPDGAIHGNIAVDREGNVIATDRDAHRVYRVTPAQEKVHIAGNGTAGGGGEGSPALDAGLAQVRGVWVLENGGYFLGTQAGSQIWYVDTAGIIHLFLDGGPADEHSGDGEPFDTPGKKVSQIRNVSMDRQGNLLVTENDLGFVRIIERKPPY